MARCFHLTAFWVFISLSVVLKGSSEILVLLVNLGNGILINLFLNFPKSFVLNKMGYFAYNGLGDWMADAFGCLWVYGKGPSKHRFRFSLLKNLEMVLGPYYIP